MGVGNIALWTVPLIIIIILSFDIAPFPYKHAQRRITFHCQRIDVDIHMMVCTLPTIAVLKSHRQITVVSDR